MSDLKNYQNPLIERYASPQMSYVFSHEYKFTSWRKLWVALAKAEHQLGLPVTSEQVEALEKNIDNIDFEAAKKREKETRHDVMSHVYAYGLAAPEAKGIIHLGATSAFVGDNTDIIQIRAALRLVAVRLRSIMAALSQFAREYAELPTLGFTHFQPAQLTTVGKRACLWIQDLLLDYQDLQHRTETLRFRGVKGTTGTQASFLELFGGDHQKVDELDRLVSQAMGFGEDTYLTGQTYPRKIDAMCCGLLSGIAQSVSKFSNDLRLLAHMKEIEEPFEAHQIGSSAMAYKRNPMRSERMTALARFVISQAQSPAMTAATQWFERTLDDSANKRLVIPESFLAVDAMLAIYQNVVQGLVVYPKMIAKHIAAELPFMMTENIMMEAVKAGGDRQELHERIRRHAIEAGKVIKAEGGENDLLDRIDADPAFHLNKQQLEALADPVRYVGRAPQQVEAFLTRWIDPIAQNHPEEDQLDTDLRV